MPALQTVTVNDRESTPIAHIFVPRDVKDGVGLLVRSSGVPVGEERLTSSMRKAGANFRGKATIAIPVVATQVINGVSTPVLVRTAYVELNATFHETSTEQERTNIMGITANLLATGQPFIHNSFVKLEGVYGS